MINCKRGAEPLLSIWWFVVLALVGTGIVSAVIIYYSAEIDIKGAETTILNERLFGCLNENGFLAYDFFNESFNIFRYCGISESVIKSGGNFYFKVEIKDLSGNSEGVVRGGDASLESDCNVAASQKISAKHYPSCKSDYEDVSYLKNGELKRGKLTILSASNQMGSVA